MVSRKAYSSYEGDAPDTPTAASLTWRNQNGNSVADGNGALVISADAVNNDWTTLEVDAPATPWSCYMRADHIIAGGSSQLTTCFMAAGICAIDNVGGDMVVMTNILQRQASDEQNLPNTRLMTGANTTGTFGDSTHRQNTLELMKWVRLDNDGTTLTGYTSKDGLNWLQIGSVLISTPGPGTVDKVGIGFRIETCTGLVVVQNFGFTAPS